MLVAAILSGYIVSCGLWKTCDTGNVPYAPPQPLYPQNNLRIIAIIWVSRIMIPPLIFILVIRAPISEIGILVCYSNIIIIIILLYYYSTQGPLLYSGYYRMGT